MRYLKTLSTCLAALALQSVAWAQIYETTDAHGNPVFTDSPPGPDAEEVDLQQTNIIDAPAQEPQQVSAPQSVVEEQAPVQEGQTIIVNNGNDNEEQEYDSNLRRERAFNRMDPAAPHEVLDAEAPHEVLDAEAPREVGDSNSQMPDEVGDFDTPIQAEAGEQVLPEAGVDPVRHRVVHPHRR